MVTPSEFDLNAAIQRWRENLSHSPQFRAENLDELEAHLRDAIATMQGQRLTDEEVFLVATRRLGGVHALEPEFAKINAREVWLNRALWMLIGVQFWFVISSTARLAAGLASFGGLMSFGRGWMPAPEQAWSGALAAIFLVAYVAVLALGLWGGSRLIRWRERELNRCAAHVLNRPMLLGLALVVGFAAALVIQFAGSAEMMVFRTQLPIQQIGFLATSTMWGFFGIGLIQIVVFLAGTALLARRLQLQKAQSRLNG